jgi:hypothetical protein
MKWPLSWLLNFPAYKDHLNTPNSFDGIVAFSVMSSTDCVDLAALYITVFCTIFGLAII